MKAQAQREQGITNGKYRGNDEIGKLMHDARKELLPCVKLWKI